MCIVVVIKITTIIIVNIFLFFGVILAVFVKVEYFVLIKKIGALGDTYRRNIVLMAHKILFLSLKIIFLL